MFKLSHLVFNFTIIHYQELTLFNHLVVIILVITCSNFFCETWKLQSLMSKL